MSAAPAKARGELAERLAEKHLRSQGLKTVARNYRCRAGEIDLVMLDREAIVFTEVRYRASTLFGTPDESIDFNKQTKLVKCANHYLMTHQQDRDRACRFDVVLLSGPLDDASLEWIIDAFQA